MKVKILFETKLLRFFLTKKFAWRVFNILIHKPLSAWMFFGLFLNRKKKNNYFLPLSIDIEPNTKCNLACKFCQVPGWERAKINDMSIQLFEKVLDQFPTLLIIKLQGMGEPLLNPYLFDMIKMASDRNCLVYTTINGTLLNEGNIKKIVESDLIAVTISLDGAKKETFESIRGNANFEKVISSTKKLLRSRKGKLPEINVWMVISSDNYQEIPEMIKLCKDIGVDNLTVQLEMYSYGKDSIHEKIMEHRIKEDSNFEAYKRQCTELAKREKMNFQFHQTSFDKHHPCLWPWTSLYVSAEGKIVPCCRIGDPDVIHFGSIQEKRIKEIWNSDEYNQFRNAIKSNRIRSFCRQCYHRFGSETRGNLIKEG
jgi:pyrroloquinoline quinone biosynthesis protein E